MQLSARPADVLFFHCGFCRTELSVPVALQGIDGPCPGCGQDISAPLCPVPVLPQRVYLPPLDRTHESPQDPAQAVALPAETGPVRLSARHRQVGLSAPSDVRTVLTTSEADDEAASELPPRWGSTSIPIPVRPLPPPPIRESGERPVGRPMPLASINPGSVPPAGLADPTSRSRSRNLLVGLLILLGGMAAGVALYLKNRERGLDFPWKAESSRGPVEASGAVSGPVWFTRDRADSPETQVLEPAVSGPQAKREAAEAVSPAVMSLDPEPENQ